MSVTPCFDNDIYTYTMNHVTAGIILSMSSLILLYQNRWALGLAAFVLGIIIMNKKNWRK